jgi:hypothetical protein
LHQYAVEQPDCQWENPKVREGELLGFLLSEGLSGGVQYGIRDSVLRYRQVLVGTGLFGFQGKLRTPIPYMIRLTKQMALPARRVLPVIQG